MTTCADLIRIARQRYLLSEAGEQRNRLTANYTAGQTTLAFQYPLQGIVAGATLSIGLNTFYVWEANVSNQTATVQGGYNSSIDSNASIGDAVTVTPAWSTHDLFYALNEELAALSAPMTGLFQMKQTEFTYNPSRVGFDLPGITNVTSIYELRITQPDQFQRTPRLGNGDWRLERNYLASENSSGYSLKLLTGGYPGQTITVLYRAPFTLFTALTDDVTLTGFPTTGLDILPMGAAIRVGLGREIRRNDTTRQGDTRRAEEVPAGAVAGAWRGLQGERQQRISDELTRLVAAYPPRLG